MKPKEKAEKLFNDFYVETYAFHKYEAKKYAIICVNEILKYCPENEFQAQFGMTYEQYFDEVKTEIEKM